MAKRKPKLKKLTDKLTAYELEKLSPELMKDLNLLARFRFELYPQVKCAPRDMLQFLLKYNQTLNQQ